MKNLHLLVTTICDRDCPHCCNKQYDLNTVHQVTDQELCECENIYITGGEPFKYSAPNKIAGYLKDKYPNIKKVIVYTNAYEFEDYLLQGGHTFNLDGVTVSIKSSRDVISFYHVREIMVRPEHLYSLKSNYLYVFDGRNVCWPEHGENINFVTKSRTWQEKFKPAPESIFRRM